MGKGLEFQTHGLFEQGIFQRLIEGNTLTTFMMFIGSGYFVTSFLQKSAEKNIPSKTSRLTSSVPWIIPEISKNIHRPDNCTLES